MTRTRVRQYRKRKEAEMEAWSNIRQTMLDKDAICCFCPNNAECRCLQCGILQLMRVECCTKKHKQSLHVPYQRYGRLVNVTAFICMSCMNTCTVVMVNV